MGRKNLRSLKSMEVQEKPMKVQEEGLFFLSGLEK